MAEKSYHILETVGTLSFYSKLTPQGAIYFNGPDAAKFLQGQLTCDVNKITETVLQPGARCNLQGRVVSFFNLVRWQDGYLMLLPKSMVQLTIDDLKKYAVFFKTKIEDYSEQLCFYAAKTDRPISIKNILNFEVIPSGFLFIASHTQTEVLEAALKQHASIADEVHWHAAKISQLIPDIVPETSGKYLPHELNLPELGAVSFDKGCYLGQEIVARMEYRGHVKQHLHLIQTGAIADLHLNENISNSDGKNIGSLVDYVMIENQLFGLALLRDQETAAKLTLRDKVIRLAAMQ